jgi:hypothetical protein
VVAGKIVGPAVAAVTKVIAPVVVAKAMKAVAAPVVKNAPVVKKSADVRKAEKTKLYATLLKRPAAAVRPKFSEDPVAYRGGRIYFSKPKNAFRVYTRKADRIETTIGVADDADKLEKFQVACAMVEVDPRPIG